MQKLITATVLIILCTAGLHAQSGTAPQQRDLYADTWVGTDALGRPMPEISQVGPPKPGRRVVGIFYVTWHRDDKAKLKAPYRGDVNKILTQDPAARLDAKHPLWQYGSYHWGEPENGYFLSRDEFVIRQDMSMLSDAGVDVLVIDVTNAVRYWEEWETLFSTMLKIRREGNKTPEFCFWAFNGPVITVVQELYDRIYKQNRYRELWFHWDDKPLLLYNSNPFVDATGKKHQNPNPHYQAEAVTDKNHPQHGNPDYTDKFYHDYTSEVKSFFTLRTMWWGYWQWAGKRFVGTENNWSFGLDLGHEPVKILKPEELVSTRNGVAEQAAVTPAQHSTTMIGKSWSRAAGEPQLNEFDLPEPTYVPWLGKTVENPEGYGIYFQERFDEAIACDPQFLYINDWNEWIAGKYHPAEGRHYNFMRRPDSTYRFVDQYNAEFNRGIQPMKGDYTDNYYMQMAQNIRRYKGVRPIPEHGGFHSIRIDGEFEDWNAVAIEFRDTSHDTFHRDYPGYGGEHYRNDSGRNDIITCKAAVDADHIFLFAATRETLTAHTGSNWMLLLIDADNNHSTGWHGYDFLINKTPFDASTTSVHRFADSGEEGSWKSVARVSYRYKETELEIALPRNLLALNGDSIIFDFHWCDNPRDLKTPISLCTHGDSAPNRRFNYRFVWRK